MRWDFGDYRVVAVYDPTTDRCATIYPIKDEYGQWTGRCVVKCGSWRAIRTGWDQALALGDRLVSLRGGIRRG